MFLNCLKRVPPHFRAGLIFKQHRSIGLKKPIFRPLHPEYQESNIELKDELPPETVKASDERLMGEIFPTPKVVPMVLSNKDHIVLPFNDVPGPKSLKLLSNFREYMSEVGTQITVALLKFALNIDSYIQTKKPIKNLSVLFDEYGPVVRFISPLGRDIVLINHPDHIQKVYTTEGEFPVRSTLDSLEKYRNEHRNPVFGGVFTAQGQEWYRQRSTLYSPLHKSVSHHMSGLNDMCEGFAHKVYNMRNYHDEVSKDLYKELHKWAFDCLGLVLFSKRFTMVNTEIVYSQCDMSWLYHSLDKATDAIIKCESGLHFWKLFNTPAWKTLVKHCDSLDSLIGKYVIEAEQALTYSSGIESSDGQNSLINAMLLGEEKMSPEDIATVIMDLLLIGVNTITSSTSFLLYHLAKHQRVQNVLHKEIEMACPRLEHIDMTTIRDETPYLQACIKETLRLVPPIPVLTRILPKNITLDRYNIPKGTLIIMSPQDASLNESNYENSKAFIPERWLKADAKEYHAFASIPFGYGVRKCLGQNIAESMMTVLTIRLMQKYKLVYHYGDIEPKRSFIAKPNKPLKIRFIDRA